MSLRRSQRLQTNIKETETVTDNIVSKKRVKPTTIEEQIITDNITDNINYYSYFFRKDIVSNYISDLNNKINLLKQENPSLKTPMDYYKIYNLDSILEYCGTKTTYNLRSNPQNEEERKNQIEELKIFLASQICSGIGENYARAAVSKAFEKKEFDIAVLATPQMEENIDINEDENISESQLTDYSQMTEYEDYSWLLGKDKKDSNQDKEYLPSNFRSIHNALRNKNLFKYRTSSIKAFIIVELGECKLYPNAFSVNLICAKKGDTTNPLDVNSGAFSGSGNILMGLYLYSILSHPELKNTNFDKYNITFPKGKAILSQVPKKIKIEDKSKFTVGEETELDIDEVIFKEPLIPVQHIAVLELAGAYTNAGGLCSYEKFGYSYDPSLYGSNCFEDHNNLPMIIYFNTEYEGNDLIKKSRVISIAAGDKKTDFKKSAICNIRDNMKQSVLGYLKNYKIYEDNNVNLDDFKEYYNMSNEMEQLLMYLNRGGMITIDSIINYLENPQQKPNKTIENMIVKIYNNMNNSVSGGKKTKNYTKKKKYIINKKSNKNIKKNKTKKLKKYKR